MPNVGHEEEEREKHRRERHGEQQGSHIDEPICPVPEKVHV